MVLTALFKKIVQHKSYKLLKSASQSIIKNNKFIPEYS